ncbi:MAG: Pdz/Dhr/GlgF [Chlorobi bacterium]|nr:Pdz/Dhr/GlgF [Chlorobiota bacterium]
MVKKVIPVLCGLLAAGMAMAQDSRPTVPMPPMPPVPPMPPMAISMMGGSFLGVMPEEVTADRAKELGLAEEYGALLKEVSDGGPAAKAGLKANDVIVEWNGTRVESAMQLRRLVHETPAGRSVKIAYIRGGHRNQIELKVGQSPDMGMMGNMMMRHGEKNQSMDSLFGSMGPETSYFMMPHTGRLGVTMQNLSPQLATYFGLKDRTGALISDVSEKSAAANAGLAAGDIVITVDGEKVNSPGDLRKAIGSREGEVKLGIIRDKQERTITVKLPAKGSIEGFAPEMNENFGNQEMPFQMFQNFSAPESYQMFFFGGDDEQNDAPEAPRNAPREQRETPELGNMMEKQRVEPRRHPQTPGEQLMGPRRQARQEAPEARDI